jgi:hypothetical protein
MAAAAVPAVAVAKVGTKRPCEQPELARELVSHGFGSELAQELERVAIDPAASFTWPAGYDAQNARWIWNRIVQLFDEDLQTRMLPVLLRIGMHSQLNQLSRSGYTVFEETLRESPAAAALVLQEHKRDPANCPIDFNSGRSLLQSALATFQSDPMQKWIVYVAQHSTQASLNARTSCDRTNAVSLVLGGRQDALLLRLRTLTSASISPDDESGLLWLDGAANIWKWDRPECWRETDPGTWVDPQQYIRQRTDDANLRKLCAQFPTLDIAPPVSDQDKADAVHLMDTVMARHATYRVLAQQALDMHLRGVRPLCVLVASYVTPRLAAFVSAATAVPSSHVLSFSRVVRR